MPGASVWIVLTLGTHPGSTVWSKIMSEKVIKSLYSEYEWMNNNRYTRRLEVRMTGSNCRTASGGQLIRRQEWTQTECMNQEVLVQEGRTRWMVRGQRTVSKMEACCTKRGWLLCHRAAMASGLSHMSTLSWWGFLEVCVEPWYRTRKSCTMGHPGTQIKGALGR